MAQDICAHMALQRKEGTACTALSNGCISAKGELKLCTMWKQSPFKPLQSSFDNGKPTLFIQSTICVCVCARVCLFACVCVQCEVLQPLHMQQTCVKVIGQYQVSVLAFYHALPLHILGLLIQEPPGFSPIFVPSSARALAFLRYTLLCLTFHDSCVNLK